MNGKGSKPRNCHTQRFRDNHDSIDWRKKAAVSTHNLSKTLTVIFAPSGRDGDRYAHQKGLTRYNYAVVNTLDGFDRLRGICCPVTVVKLPEWQEGKSEEFLSQVAFWEKSVWQPPSILDLTENLNTPTI